MWVGAYFGGLIMFMLICILAAMVNPNELKTKGVFPALILLAVTWPISFPLILTLGQKHIK